MGVENNIPEGWKEVPLKEILLKRNQGVNTTTEKVIYSTKGHRVVKAQDILERKINFSVSDYVDRQEYARLSTHVKPKLNDILYSNIGSKMGNAAKVKSDFQFIIAWNVLRLQINTDEAEVDFLVQLLNSKTIRRAICSLNSSSTMPFVSGGVIELFEINLPPLPEQKAIAKVLTAFDDKIELLKAQNKTLEAMAQTIFKEWFGKHQIGDELPEGWSLVKLGDILETYLGGTPSKSKPEYWENGSIPWINSGEVNNFRITKGTTLITKLGLEKSATKLLPKGTVVIAITGATLGQYSILEIESCFNQSVVGIVGNNKIKSSFIYFWIANNIHAIIRNATGGAQQHINKENVNSFEMIIPSDEILNKFQSAVEPMMDKISNNEFEIQSLTKTRDTLLPKLMSGQVRVNNIKQTIDA
jgi:type I restriction enzyme, S subunit